MKNPEERPEPTAQILACLTKKQHALLRWLLCYPFLRAEDLSLFESHERKLSPLYRHLKVLTTHRLIEAVHPALLGRRELCACYHLSDTGLQVVARDLARDPFTLAHTYHTDERSLLQLLPRLSEIVHLQALMGSIIGDAPDEFAREGQRSEVTWYWERAYQHIGVQEGKRWTVRTDSVLLLRVRPMTPTFPDALRMERARRLAEQGERWYQLFLYLDSPLLEEAMISARLAAHLSARAARRAGEDGVDAPLLIVTAYPHRAELWRRALLHLAADDPLLGAIMMLKASDSLSLQGREALFHRSLLRLSDGVACTLRDLLSPQPATHLLEPLLARLKQTQQLCELRPANTQAKHENHHSPSVIIGQFDRRAGVKGASSLPTPLLGLALSKRGAALLTLLYLHPLLSERELGALLPVHPDSVRRYLTTLKGLGCVEYGTRHPLWSSHVSPDPGKLAGRWYVTEKGMHVLAKTHQLKAHHMVLLWPEEAEASVQVVMQRTLVSITRRHFWGSRFALYDAIHSFAESREPRTSQVWWEDRERARIPFFSQGNRMTLQPAAWVAFSVGTRTYPFWLEVEQEPRTSQELATLLHTYRRYVLSRAWVPLSRRLPWLLWLVAGPVQEQRVGRLARQILAGTGSHLQMYTTTIPRLRSGGPFAPIWREVLSPRGPDPTSRIAIFRAQEEE